VDYKVVGRTMLLPVSRQMLVVLPGRKGGDYDLEVATLDDSIEGFPRGSVRFANFTKSDMYVKVDDKVSKLAKRNFSLLNLKNLAKGGYVPMTYANAQGEKVHFTRLYMHSGVRKIVLISPSTRKKGSPFSFTYLQENLPQ